MWISKEKYTEVIIIVHKSSLTFMTGSIDAFRMPYFQAFLLEVHRCANVVPNPVPRIAPKDWYLRGHKIPKVSLVLEFTH